MMNSILILLSLFSINQAEYVKWEYKKEAQESLGKRSIETENVLLNFAYIAFI